MFSKILKPIVSLALVIAAVGSLGASFSKEDAGTSAAQFLKLGAGVRASSMGDAFCGISDDSTAIYWNPAGLTQLQSGSLCLTHAIWVEDIFYDWISYARPVGETSAIGIGVQYQSYGELKEADNNGLELGKFSPNDMAATLSYAFMVGDFSVGLSGKYISCLIKDNPAVSYAGDMGLMYKPIGSKLGLGLAVQNVGAKIKFEQEEEELPMNARAGASLDMNKDWVLALDVNAPIDNEINLGFGTEYKLELTRELGLVCRGGYTTKKKDLGDLSGLTGGLGIKVGDMHFDYAFIPFGDLDSIQKISFSIDF